MPRQRKKVDRVYLQWEQAMLVSDGQKLAKEMKQLLTALEKCLEGDNPAFPIWTRDILEKATGLYQLGGCHAVLANILVKR
jgi:hypothetical protein